MSDYLKRYAAPRSWTLLRKQYAYITKPSAGPHAIEKSMPLSQFIKILGFAETGKETKKLLNTQLVLVDGRRVKNIKLPIGLMDVISVPAVSKHFRALMDKKGRIVLSKIEEKEATTKACRVLGKKKVRGGKINLSLSGGRSLLGDDSAKVGDTIVLTLPGQKVISTLKLEPGANILLTAGRHAGEKGKVEDVSAGLVKYKTADGSARTKKEYAFVIPEEMA